MNNYIPTTGKPRRKGKIIYDLPKLQEERKFEQTNY